MIDTREEAELRKFHQENVLGGCCGCEQDWPCDAIRLAEEVERLRGWYSASQEAHTETLTCLREYREALEKIASADESEDDPDCDTGRMREIARAALEVTND